MYICIFILNHIMLHKETTVLEISHSFFFLEEEDIYNIQYILCYSKHHTPKTLLPDNWNVNKAILGKSEKEPLMRSSRRFLL